jgi:site-specific recombinase XerD
MAGIVLQDFGSLGLTLADMVLDRDRTKPLHNSALEQLAYIPRRGACFHSVVIVQGVGVKPGPLPLLILQNSNVSETVLSYIVNGKIADMSFATKKRTVHSIGLSYDYYISKGSPIVSRPEEVSRFLDLFFKAITSGTIERSSLNTKDDTGLWWTGQNKRYPYLIKHDVEMFIYYSITNLNILSFASPEEKYFFDNVIAAAYEESKYSNSPYSFFYHLTKLRPMSHVAAVMSKPKHKKQISITDNKNKQKRFPVERRMELLVHGARSKPYDPYDMSIYKENPLISRDQSILGLFLFCGPRCSEICHMFVQDVVPSKSLDQGVIISLAHPEDSPMILEGHKETILRREYLWRRYRMLPMTQLTGARYVGWKGILQDDAKGKRAFLALVARQEEQKYFCDMLRIYIRLSRPKLLLKGPSPYLFLTKTGDPMTPRNLRDIWDAACNRIGVEDSSPHSSRHMVGDLVLNKLALGAKFTKDILHHRSIGSQAVYTLSDLHDVQSYINKAFTNIQINDVSPDNISKADVFVKIDPDRLYSEFLTGKEICLDLW